jgi:hypothetical protein
LVALNWSWISALLLSFWVSRLFLRLFLRLRLPLKPVSRLLAVHGTAGAALFLFVGLLKSYFSAFAAQEAMIVLYTQAIWLALDYFVTGPRHLAGERGR